MTYSINELNSLSCLPLFMVNIALFKQLLHAPDTFSRYELCSSSVAQASAMHTVSYQNTWFDIEIKCRNQKWARKGIYKTSFMFSPRWSIYIYIEILTWIARSGIIWQKTVQVKWHRPSSSKTQNLLLGTCGNPVKSSCQTLSIWTRTVVGECISWQAMDALHSLVSVQNCLFKADEPRPSSCSTIGPAPGSKLWKLQFNPWFGEKAFWSWSVWQLLDSMHLQYVRVSTLAIEDSPSFLCSVLFANRIFELK